MTAVSLWLYSVKIKLGAVMGRFHLDTFFSGRKSGQDNEEQYERMEVLDKKFLQTPKEAVSQSRLATKLMFDETKDSYVLVSGLLDEYEDGIFTRIKKSEEKVDQYEDQICNYLMEISKARLETPESQEVSVLLHTITDIETISDCTCSIAMAYRNVYEKKIHFSKEAEEELKLAQGAVKTLLEEIRTLFDNQERINNAFACYQVVVELLDMLREKHIERLKNSRCMIECGLILTDIVNYYERISVRCNRIVNYLAQEGNKELKIHEREYWFPVNEYQELYDEYKNKYSLK